MHDVIRTEQAERSRARVLAAARRVLLAPGATLEQAASADEHGGRQPAVQLAQVLQPLVRPSALAAGSADRP
jgi:hypothetical protein